MSDFENAFNIQKHIAAPSIGDFGLPPTITTDFAALIQKDIPNFVYTARLVQDWSQKDSEGEEEKYIRCAMYPINWKSNFAAADEGVNFRTDYSHMVKKGDMLIREDGEVFILTWAVHRQINNQPSQAKKCNFRLTITRDIPETVDEYGFAAEEAGTEDVVSETVDEYGFVVEEAGEEVGEEAGEEAGEEEEEEEEEEAGEEEEEEAGTKVIVSEMPSCIFQYDGRPDYSPGFNTPGIVPDNLTILECQYNPETAKIRVNDTFVWGISTFRIINLNPTGLNIAGTAGLLQLHARRIAGGELDGI